MTEKQIKVGSDFSGVGAFDQALIRLGIPYKMVFACDMDKYARQTYIENYGEPNYFPENVYDREIPKEPLDIFMTSPPCQAFSLAGKRKGEDDERGILFYNSHEFIQKNRPRYFIFENVKGLISDDSGKTFQRWCDFLGGKSVNGNPVIFPHEESVPYHIYWKVINAKDHNVPQNRERVFIVGIRDEEDNVFRWPKDEPLTKKLKDVLFHEDEVYEKYFLSQKAIDKLLSISDDGQIKVKSATSNGYEIATEEDSINMSVPSSKTRRGRVGKGVAQTLDTACNQAVAIAHVSRSEEGKAARKKAMAKGKDHTPFQSKKIEFKEGDVMNCITTATTKDNMVIQMNPSKESGGKQPYKHNRVYDSNGVSPVLDTECGRCGYKIEHRVRNLTPRECFRLMDFPDCFIDVIESSNTINKQGIIVIFEEKKLWKSVVPKNVLEKLSQRDTALCTIKECENTGMQILFSSTPTEKIENVELRVVVTQYLQRKCVRDTTIPTGSTENLYELMKESGKYVKIKSRTEEGHFAVDKQNTELCMNLTISENFEKVNAYITSTVIPKTIIPTICMHSKRKPHIIRLIINYSGLQDSLSIKESLALKMANTISISDRQAYKQAGNSIVVAVLAKIIERLKL